MSVIEDLERADQKSAYEKEMERKSPARCVEEVRNIWLSLNEYFCEINEKVISLRSTEWVGDNPIIETNYTRHNGELGRLGLPISRKMGCCGYNQFENPLKDVYHRSKEMDFVPFLLEDFVFTIKSTKSSIKKNVFGKWLDTPPLGYILVGSQAVRGMLKVHLTLEDTSLTGKRFREKMRVFGIVKALTHIESISADLFNLFKDQNSAFLEEMKDLLDPSKVYNPVIFERKSMALTVLNHNMKLAHKVWQMTKTLTQTLKETVSHNRGRHGGMVYRDLPMLLDLFEETRGITQKMSGHSSMTWREEKNSIGVGLLVWNDFTNHSGTYLFSNDFIQKVERNLHLVGSLSVVERFLTSVYQWGGGEENCSAEVLSCFTDHTNGKFDLDNTYSW